MKLSRILLFFLGGILLMTTSPAFAARMYVTDELKLTVRTQTNLRSRILKIIETGDVVEVLSESDDWVLVRLADDTEGWVLKRYLTDRETAARKLARLQSIHTSTTKQNAELLQKNKELLKENKELRATATQQSKKLEELETAYETLKTESADFLDLKAAHQEAQSKLTNQTRKVSTLENKVAKLQTRQTIYWFLSGAGVLVFGFIIGFSAKRQRRKPSLLQ